LGPDWPTRYPETFFLIAAGRHRLTHISVIPIPPTHEPVTLPTDEDISARLAFLDQVKSAEKTEQEARAAQLSKPSDGVVAGTQSGGAEDLEQEAANQGAFNEETGEINWDCPCLGGMAHGPW